MTTNSTSLLTPLQCVYITISVVATTINTTIIYLFLTKASLRKMHSNIFLFSLALSDLCYAAIAIPLLVRCERSNEPQPKKYCYAYAYVMVFFGYSTVYHILLAIAEKLCAICFPLKHYSRFTRSLAIKLSLSVWLLSLIASHIPMWWDYVLPSKENLKHEKAYYVFNFVTCFVLPVFMSATMYSMILHKIFKATNERLNELDDSGHSRLHMEKKAALMFGIMLAAFLFAWCAWFLDRLLNSIITGPEMYAFVTISKLLDPIFNPVLYTFLKRDFQQAFCTLFHHKKSQNNALVQLRLMQVQHGEGLYTQDTREYNTHNSFHQFSNHKVLAKTDKESLQPKEDETGL